MDKELKIMKTDYYHASIEHELENISRSIHRLKVLRACKFADRLFENGNDDYKTAQATYSSTVALLLNFGKIAEDIEDALVNEIKMQANDNKNPLVS